MRTIRKIERSIPNLRQRKKVAAYARVSVDSERMHHSLSAQVSYYSSLIQKNPEWEYAGVYADYGISGTRIKKRQEFQRMLEDAEAGKIDIILTKSIQRFARNTLDLLRTVRHLKEIGVGVWFEKENIHTLSGEGELMLTILASFAQEESRSISDNIKWRFKKKFEQGIPHAKFFVYGYRWEGNNLVTDPYEAKVVQRIFEDYLSGKTRKDIIRELKAEGIRTMYGNFFKDASIRQILTNPVYTGLLEIQKTFVVDPINKHQIYNHSEKDKYVVEHHHEAIIEPGVFEQVQVEMARRKQDGLQKGGYARKFLNTCCFTGVIKCGICGKSYTHVVRRYKGKVSEYWACESHKGKGTNCGAHGSIPEPALKEACAYVLGTEDFEEQEFLQKVAKIVVPAYKKLIFYMADGRVIEMNWESTALKDCWTEELKKKQRNWMTRYRQDGGAGRFTVFSGRIRCPRCGVTFIRTLDKRKDGAVPYWRVRGRHKCIHRTGIKEDTLKKTAASILGIPEFDAEVFKTKIKDIEIQEDGSLLFRFLDGHTEGVDLL